MPTIHAFGPFRLDPDAEMLFRGAEPIALGRRAVSLLRVLVERPGMPVSKHALIEAAIQQRFELTNGHRVYVVSLAQAGRIEEARAALARLRELLPEISIAWIERNIPFTPGPMAKFLEGFRKAGLQ